MIDKLAPGDVAELDLDGFTILVTVTDLRASYGRVDARVVPVAGAGARWVRIERLTMTEKGRTA